MGTDVSCLEENEVMHEAREWKDHGRMGAERE
jgi:hypothetical protein